jgi:hypothetical protein
MGNCNRLHLSCIQQQQWQRENDDFDDASLLASRADKLYEEAENLDILMMELEGE